jgi:hypothetical protein
VFYDFIWAWRQEFGGGPRVDIEELGKWKPFDSIVEDLTSVVPQYQDISPLILSYENIFQDASMVNLDFLQDQDWN